jgi:hypothetical protein
MGTGSGKTDNEYPQTSTYNLPNDTNPPTQFLIKGLTYAPRNQNAQRYSPESYIDPLGDTWLPELHKDIPYLRQLGINTIFVDHADISQPPDQALQLLHEAGIYVLLHLFTNIALKGNPSPAEIDLQTLYSPSKVRKNLVLVSQTANHPNVLGYSISQDVHSAATTKLAALHRAAVRDTKSFLQKSGSRSIPVGAGPSANQVYRRQTMRFMAAGEPAERVDFYAFDVYDWCDPSSFQISGYKNLVEAMSDVPVPMVFGEYGAHMGKPRDLGEVECLFSPQMTGVFSGGVLHTYGHVEEVYSRREDGDERGVVGRYDLVRIRDDGARRPKRDYETYRQRLADVAAKPSGEVCGDHEKKDYKSWRGAFGGVDRMWLGDPQDVPVFPLEWSAVLE